MTFETNQYYMSSLDAIVEILAVDNFGHGDVIAYRYLTNSMAHRELVHMRMASQAMGWYRVVKQTREVTEWVRV